VACQASPLFPRIMLHNKCEKMLSIGLLFSGACRSSRFELLGAFCGGRQIKAGKDGRRGDLRTSIRGEV
jgi:hypothetical protein